MDRSHRRLFLPRNRNTGRHTLLLGILSEGWGVRTGDFNPLIKIEEYAPNYRDAVDQYHMPHILIKTGF